MMRFFRTIHFVLLGFVFSINTLCAQEELDAAMVTQAMMHVQQILLNESAFKQASMRSAEAQQAAAALNELVDGESSADIRALASDIFEHLVRDTNGNPELMMKKMQQAQGNPEAFARNWTPDQRKRLSEISNRLKEKE